MHALQHDERFLYDRRSDEVLDETLAAFAGFDRSRLDPTEWKFLARREQISVHRAVSATRQGVDSHKNRIIANGFLSAGLNDVLGGLYIEDDRELLTTQAILTPSGSTAMDAAVLMIVERRQVRAAPFRFAGVKWYSWKKHINLPSLSIGEGQECDLLTYERMGIAKTEENSWKAPKEDSQELAYHVVLSLHKPEWPLDVARGPGLRRADMAFCFLFRKVCDDLVECFALVDYDCRTSSSSRRAADTEIADRLLMISRLPDCARAKILSGFARKTKGRAVVMSKTCLRCGSRKKVMDPLRSCCICKKSVCRKCFELKTIFSINSRTHEPETDMFCYKCLARIDTLTAKKNAQHNASASASSGGSSTGGSSRDKDRESHSGNSSERNNNFKFWKKSKHKRESSPRSRRRPSFSATRIRRAEGHLPNYDGLFQKYDVFGRASDTPRRRHMYEEKEFEFEEEQEPEKEQDNGEPQRDERWRQRTFLASPEAAAAEAAAANRLSIPRQRLLPVVRARECTVAEVYPVAKTVLEREDVCSADGNDSPHNEAERAHLLYLGRRQRLELEDQQSFCRREILATPLNRAIRANSVQAPHAERKPAALTCHSESSIRATRRVREESEETFRMDLYGRF